MDAAPGFRWLFGHCHLGSPHNDALLETHKTVGSQTPKREKALTLHRRREPPAQPTDRTARTGYFFGAGFPFCAHITPLFKLTSNRKHFMICAK